MIEKQRLLGLVKQSCKETNVAGLENVAFSSSLREIMQAVADFLRALVEVVPRDQKKNLVPSWRATPLETIAHLAV